MTREYKINEQDTKDNLRNIGYSLKEAVADLVDNSIDAKASKIFIEYSFREDDDEGYIAIADNGSGMNQEELDNAFSYQKNNTVIGNRLGFFGLGLKTASFSMCDKLSIITKKKGSNSYRGMVDMNENKNTIHDEFDDPNNITTLLENENHSNCLPIKLSQGTIVMWSEINDRLGRSLSNNASKDSHNILTTIKNHLSLIFFDKIKKKEIEIFVGRNNWNKKPIDFFDPFMSSEDNTQNLQEEKIEVESLKGKIKIQPYIVPNIESFSEEKREELIRFYNWNELQGIYILRNNRLLSYGKWHDLKFQTKRLIEGSHQYRNLRIKVSLNDLKNLEKLDLNINKSKINLPIEVKEHLSIKLDKIIKEYNRRLNTIRVKKIYTYKGKDRSLWKKNHNQNLEIDRSHPIIKDLLSDDLLEKKFKQLLTMLNQQQNQHNLINIILKFQELDRSSKDVLIAQMKDMAIQLKDKLPDKEDVIQVLVALYKDTDPEISYSFVNEMVIKK